MSTETTGDWYCRNCGYVCGSRVTFSETCDTCHQPVDWHDAKNMSDIHVVVAENDKPIQFREGGSIHTDDGGPLVFEQYTRTATLENIKQRAKHLGANYGKCRIAKLVFIDEDES